jgi:hypothetical protein
VEVSWPSGETSSLVDVDLNSTLEVVEGKTQRDQAIDQSAAHSPASRVSANEPR